ncbi:MAG TPA: class I SAM-dependent methyltransferase [Pseudonocardiaceae bacterium]
MGYPFTLYDVAFLRSPAGEEALAAAAGLALIDASRLSDVDTVRRMVGPRLAAAVLETAVLRRRAASKVDGADRWLFTGDALQQASASPVARHRASRLAGLDVHDVTCSVGVDLAALAAQARRAVGSDLDPVRLAMAARNLRSSPAALLRADALRPTSRGTVVYADPARRDSTGRRRWRPADFTPSLDALATVYSGRPLVVKSAPGMDFGSAPWAAEIELVSLDGEVREACLWSARLATSGVARRATVLSTSGPQWTVTDADPADCPVRPPGEWLVNPDGAVVRAGLVRQYGARHGLGQLDQRIAYLTGDAPPPGVRAFRVLEHGHYSEKELRATLHRLDAGTVEILVRGLDVDPNALRPRLRLRGSAAYTVVLTRIGRTPTAFICRPERA